MTHVWVVHVTVDPAGPCSERPIDYIASNVGGALHEAYHRSLAVGVKAAAVTKFSVDALGDHRRVALYVDGIRQECPHRIDRSREYVPG